MSQESLEEQKQVEFYAASVNAWLTTAFELDKSLLTLSAGGVGLLLTLVTTVGISSAEGLVLFVSAIFSFLLCVIVLLVAFKKNQGHIEQVIQGNAASDPHLALLDKVAAISFGVGILLSTIIGISAAVNSYSEKELKMSKDKITGMAHDSVNGLANLSGQTAITKSINGLGALPPQAVQQQSTVPAAPPAQPASSDKK